MRCGLTLWQSPQPTAAWVKRAVADEVSETCCLGLLRDSLTNSSQNIQYLILALFWLTSKPVARKFIVIFTKSLVLAHNFSESSGPLSLHHLLTLPCTHIHPHHSDASIPPTWATRYGRRGANPPSSLEEAASLGQR